jgi:hypothetical protein
MDLYVHDSYRVISLWIIKGLFLGLWLISFGTIAYLYLAVYRRLPSDAAVGIDVFSSLIIHNPFWWIGCTTCLAIGLFVTHSWSGRPALWIVLAVTELFPLALVAMFFTLVARNKEMIEKMKDMR